MDKNYKIFVINMPKSKERWEYISAQLDKLGLPYTNSHLYYQYNVDVKSLFPPIVFHRGVSSDRITDYRKVVRNFYPFARQVFQLKSYVGKLLYLAKRDGMSLFLKRIINLKTIFPPKPL